MAGISNSIVVVNFNGQLPLLAFLKSLRLNEALSTEVILVDNGSFDESVAMVRKHYPAIRVLQQPTNRGFWAAANKGIDHAEGDVVVLCHSDVLADVHTLTDLADQLREAAGRKVAAVLPIVQGVDGEEQPTVGALPSFFNMLIGAVSPRASARLELPTLDHLQDGQWARFICVAISRDAINTMGGFDERFFLYQGDADWCARLQNKQLRVLFSRTVKVTHVGAKSFVSLPDHLIRLLRRDQHAYACKYLPAWQRSLFVLTGNACVKVGGR